MPDYAGACKAIRDKFVADYAGVPFRFMNDAPIGLPNDSGGSPSAHGTLEIQTLGSERYPGGREKRYDGIIMFHAFVPIGTGPDEVEAIVQAAGDVFENKVFYEAGGCHVKTYTATPVGGDEDSDDGLYFNLSIGVPFHYWHIFP